MKEEHKLILNLIESYLEKKSKSKIWTGTFQSWH